jgi:hypothetical protein
LRSPNFQQFRLMSIYLVAIFSTIAGLGIKLRGPRLLAFSLITFVGLSYLRGLMMFFFVVPIILARPAAECFWPLASQLSGTSAFTREKVVDSVLLFLQKRSFVVLAGCIAIAALITASTWWRQDIAPSKDITPEAAVDFVRRTNITGNVFNSYQFGGYLIFSDIPTFVDGRALPFGDAFLHNSFDTENLVDINRAFGTLDDYKVNWIVLPPNEPLAKALIRNPLWGEVYSDKFSVVFVRRRERLN